MVFNVDVDGNINPREISRESEQWRAAVYARLGINCRETNEIQAHQLQEFAAVKKEL